MLNILRDRPLAIAVAALVGWLALSGLAGPAAARLAGIQKNDAALFLPGQAEATRVFQLEQGFEAAGATPAVVVFSKPVAITAGDRAAVAVRVARLSGVAGVAGAASPVVPSRDGRALEVVVPVSNANITGLVSTVKSIRAEVAGVPGLETHVTGPAGLAADFGAAFGGLDVKLLALTTLVVVAILLLVYRSPFLWVLPLAGAGLALVAAQAGVYLAATRLGLQTNGQSQGILTVLVFGAGTDYALLLISRYREELRRHQRTGHAMAAAWRGAAPAVVASGTTVMLALLCLLLSENGANRSLGPTGAIGIAAAMLAMLTFLPGALLLGGRRIFWPAAPRAGSEPRPGGAWTRIAALVGRRPRALWAGSLVLLGVLAAGITQLDASGLPATGQYTVAVDSVTGQRALDAHFPAGSGDPAVVLANAAEGQAVLAAARRAPGVASATLLTTPAAAGAAPVTSGGRVLIQVTLAAASGTPAAEDAVRSLRTAVHAVPGAGALVGGTTAVAVDTAAASARDEAVIIPIVLLVVAAVLAVLLRSLVAPALLIATVVLSYAATLGASGFAFSRVFHFAGADPSFPLTAFVFLVALGVDYNIFLMTRVREEARGTGTRSGVLAGLAATGSVITSAGVVLAATFSVFGALPLVVLAEIGFAVAFGVLLDTAVVRTLLVPALVHELGDRVWWPGRAPGPASRPAEVAQAGRHGYAASR